jgi:hypothetical protein
LLNVPVSTVDSWRSNNRIPRWRQPAILDLAHRLEKSVSTADFPARAA